MSVLRPNPIERAYELARSGIVTTVEEIATRLQREGYLDVSHQLNGPLLRKQLRELLRSRQTGTESKRT